MTSAPAQTWNIEVARARIDSLARLPGALLPILHALQDEFSYIDDAAIPLIVDALNLSRAEVVGVIHFYHDFRVDPPGRHILRVCRAEACQSMGSERLVAHIEERMGTAMGATSEDGGITLQDVYCLGNCALSPAVMLDGQLHGRVTSGRLDALLADLDSDPLPLPWGRVGVGVGPSFAPAPVRVYVPRDAAALSVGADDVALTVATEARARGFDVTVVRNGSRGMLWLEPLVEVETERGRVAYGPVSGEDVPRLFDAGFLDGAPDTLHLGPTEAIPYFARQQRLTFARCGAIDPLSLTDYRAHGGFEGLARALALSREEIVAEVTESGLRGRGGAGFPTGIKWRTVLDAPAGQKYIVCNADEGDSGTFADRMLIEGDPFSLIEGMTIAGIAVGATQGYVYLRSEYPHAFRALTEAITIAREQGYLGERVAGSEHAFDIDVRLGAGAYICGEETALLESLEGRRGVIRPRPPLPAVKGLFSRPTVVNNVLSLATVPVILERGAAHYQGFGVGRSRGTQPVQLAGNVRQGGLIELAFGVTLREVIEGFGGGTASGRPLRAVQVGGPLGAYFPESMLDTPLDYEALAAAQGLLGHGGIVVFDDTVDLARQARFAMEFCAIESCGKCTPCRIGSTRGVEVIDRIIAGEDRTANLELLDDLNTLMMGASLCALGGLTPIPVRSALTHFPEDFASSTPVSAATGRVGVAR